MSAYVWQHACTKIQIEYIEMPELKLTLAQIRRLCDLSDEVCEPAIAALQQTGFLWRQPDGTFVRRAFGRVVRPEGAPFVDPVLGSLVLVNRLSD
jgi:hypothetical protein